jgi:cell wall-associated NlpC family hydrolase
MSLAALSPRTAMAKVDGVVNDQSVNVRSFASVSSAVATKAEKGKDVVVYGEKGDFYKVDIDDKNEVFISKQYVTIKNNYGIVTDMDVNIRDAASVDGKAIGKAQKGDYYATGALNGDWRAIQYNGSTAYIRGDFIDAPEAAPEEEDGRTLVINVAAGEKSAVSESENSQPPEAAEQATDAAYVRVTPYDGVNLRKEPSQDSSVQAALPFGTVVRVIEKRGEWVKVAYNGEEGYAKAEFTEESAAQSSRDEMAAQIISYAERFLGTPYRYGGVDLNKGVDCSGFVYSVMRNFDVNLGRSSRDMANNGSPTPRSELQKGDLLLFSANGSVISHVAIYIGDGRYIHSTESKGRGVSYSSNFNTFVSARRVF